VGRLGFSSKG